jgi:hypothetical protein
MMKNESLIAWNHEQAAAEAAVIRSEPHELVDSDHGAKDFIITFLEQTGLWDTMVSHRPSGLKQNNGYDWRKLSGIATVKELAGVRRLSASGQVLKDAGLMARLGFTLTLSKDGSEQNVLHEDTLRNHWHRFSEAESYGWFIEDHVDLLRKKKWLRGGVYAIDGYELEVFGKDYEDAGMVWKESENRKKYGYKLVLLVNVHEGRERVVGAVLGRIEEDERKLCLKLLDLIETHLCQAKELIDILLMDRGYWGAEFLHKIHFEYGLNFVTLAKKNLNFVKDEVDYIAVNDKLPFTKYKVRNPSYYERKTDKPLKKRSGEPKHYEIWLAYENGLGFGVWEEKNLNVVIMKTQNSKGEWEVTIFVTTLTIENNPLKIYELYSQRWTIENDINRELDQRWAIHSLPGRTRNIIVARIMLILKLFNAEKILEMKYKDQYDKIKARMRETEEHNFFEEPQMVVYVVGKNIFGVWRRRAYLNVVFRQGRHAERGDILAQIKERDPDLFEKISKVLAGD